MANRKPYQLSRAQAAGLDVPETLITNDPEAVRAFRQRYQGEVVFKILTNTRTQFTETRVLTEQALEKVGAARYAPTIFQRKLEADHHLRVTFVDDAIFAARLEPERPEARYDWRLDHYVRIEAVELDARLQTKIVAVMREIGLRYGALDFIVTADGTPWFLEVNPSGQFLFVEIETRQGISRAIADALLGRHATI
jgi:glutathione synthase/RimK-type ligase-like ATP-grasp enzyme